ncbi:MAG: DEAD/DEAH box helicase [Bacteroidetes bacterium]|nr:DEAD/DEAH box helicase [Bacteroidota bacterium]
MIASIDYAKSPDIKQQIKEQQWDLLLVDEIHLCARPHSNVKATKQQQRYELVKDLSKKISNVLFLTATPHNGYSDSFASILEMINPEIVQQNGNGSITFDKSKARYNVIQRNRKSWKHGTKKQGKKSPFPQRDQKEVIIDPKPNGKLIQLLDAVERYGDFILKSAKEKDSKKVRNIANWVAIHLQKRAISSPYAVLKSLENRISTIQNKVDNLSESEEETLENYVYDLFSDDERITEEMASLRLDFEALSQDEISELKRIIEFGETLTPKDDEKLQKLKNDILPELIAKDPKIILFTKYKDTLDYLEKHLKTKDFDRFIMHGDMSLNARTEIFGKFDRAKKAILIATDVISEGLNLQRLASNVVHYELPWNPNRLEQRNGRVDRIGQKREIVNIRTLVVDKSMDKEILDLLLEKQRTIEMDRDYAAAYFGDEESLKNIILEASTRKKSRKNGVDPNLLTLFTSAGLDETKKQFDRHLVLPKKIRNARKELRKNHSTAALILNCPKLINA